MKKRPLKDLKSARCDGRFTRKIGIKNAKNQAGWHP